MSAAKIAASIITDLTILHPFNYLPHKPHGPDPEGAGNHDEPGQVGTEAEVAPNPDEEGQRPAHGAGVQKLSNLPLIAPITASNPKITNTILSI